MEFLHFDLIAFIKAAGYLGIFGFVFAESGLLIGFFLPGDSLLFTAGFLASQGYLNIWVLCIGAFLAAVIGDNVGYSFGNKIGVKLFTREDSLIFNKEHLARAQHFYEKHGRKTIIIARFVPVVRTFAPIVAGIGNMHYKTFFMFNIIGGVLWGIGISLLGFLLGNVIPDIDRYLLPIIVLIIFVSVLPGIIHILRNKEHREKLFSIFKRH
ncbi:MAG: VTT domain-containing protein [Patescibacteria group bacterium]